MNPSFLIHRLRVDLKEGIFTDVKLNFLPAEEGKIELSCHKVVLSQLPYFYNLFTIFSQKSPQENTRSTFNLTFDDEPEASVARDFVLSLYQLEPISTWPLWVFHLKLLKVKDYWNLEISEGDMKILYRLEVPEEGRHLLLQVLSILRLLHPPRISSDPKLRWLLKRTLPEDFRRANLPAEVLSAIEGGDRILKGCHERIVMADLENQLIQIYAKPHAHTDWVKSLVLLPDGKHFLSGGWDKKIKKWDLESKSCLHTFSGPDCHKGEVNFLLLLPASPGPRSGEDIEGIRPRSGEDIEGIRPRSGEDIEGIRPRSGEDIEDIRPRSGEGDQRPRPRSGEGDQRPRPRSGEDIEDTRPRSGEDIEDTRPRSGEGYQRPRPRSGEGDQRPRPRSGERGQRP